MDYFNKNKLDWRISQCCQFHDAKLLKLYNPGTVTRTYALAAGGRKKVQEKALSNLDKLYSALVNYFAKQPINLRSFRISSYLLPCYTVPECVPWYSEIEPQVKAKLKRIGDAAKMHSIRLSTHPAQYTVLASNKADVVANSISDLEYHSLFGLYAELPPGDFVVNIHLQGLYNGTRKQGIDRFATNFAYLSDYAKASLSVENEDKPKSGYDIDSVLELCSRINTRACFDIHHYECMNNAGYPLITDNIFVDAISTWGNHRPLFHVSHSKLNSSRQNEHSDILHDQDRLEKIVPMLHYADFDIEAKYKEQAVQAAYKFILEEQEYSGEPIIKEI